MQQQASDVELRLSELQTQIDRLSLALHQWHATPEDGHPTEEHLSQLLERCNETLSRVSAIDERHSKTIAQLEARLSDWSFIESRLEQDSDQRIRQFEQIIEHEDPRPQPLYNINIPTVALGRPTEVRVVRMATARWPADFDERTDPKGRRYFWAMGTPPAAIEGELTDLEAIEQGYITVTPLRIDRTEHAMLDMLEEWKLSLKVVQQR